MKTRYRLIRRGVRGGGFYCVDNKTGKRTSLRTASEDETRQIVEAKNQAERQPVLNLQIAKAYLAGTDNGITTRTWQDAIEALTVRFKDKRAITWEEHCRIVARELNPERKAFYQLAWHLGAAQSDLAHATSGGG